MDLKKYGITVKSRKWNYRGFEIEEAPGLKLVVRANGSRLKELDQEFTYNLSVYRQGALNSVYKKIDSYLLNKKKVHKPAS